MKMKRMRRPSGRGATSDAEIAMFARTMPQMGTRRAQQRVAGSGVMSDFERRLMAETARERASGATSIGEKKIRGRRVRPRPKRR